MPSLGGWEFVILIGILVLLFGAKKLPDMARSIGQSARVFKGEMKGMKGDEEPRKSDAPATEPPPALPSTDEVPRADAPRVEVPRTDAPRVEVPRGDTPQSQKTPGQ